MQVRLKPVNSKQDRLQVWSIEKQNVLAGSGSATLLNKVSGEKFNFDKIYGDQITTEQIYDDQYRSMVAKCMKGFNMTVLAYGQTASGKTFTMHGSQIDESELNRISTPSHKSETQPSKGLI